MPIGIESGNFSEILPSVLIKRVLLQNGSDPDKISINVKTLIRDNMNINSDKKILDAVKNNSYFYVILYRAGFPVQNFINPDSQERRTLTFTSDSIEERDRILQDNLSFKMVYNLGDLMRTEPVLSDHFLNSGIDVYDYYKEFDLKDIKNFKTFKIATFTHVDIRGLVDSMEEYSSVNLEFAENYLNSPTTIGTKARTFPILFIDKVSEFLNVYIDSNAQTWTGPVHMMSEGMYMKGADHNDSNNYEDPLLTVRKVRNTKVIDNRNFVNAPPPQSQESILDARQQSLQQSRTENFQRLIGSRRRRELESASTGNQIQSTRSQISNALYDNHSSDYETLGPGECYISINLNRDVYVLFNVNWLEVLKRNSPFFHLMPAMNREEVASLMSYSEIFNVCLKRRKIERKKGDRSRFLSFSPKVMKSEPPVLISSTYPFNDVTRLEIFENIVYEDLSPEDQEGIITFRGKDTSLKNEKGIFQYYVEYEFRDGFLTFFEDLMARVTSAEKQLNDFLDRASLPVAFEMVNGLQRPRIDSTGNYNSKTGEFTEAFKNAESEISLLDDVINTFVTMSRFIDADLSPSEVQSIANRARRLTLRSSAEKMLKPNQGATLSMISKFNEVFLEYKNSLDSIVKRYVKDINKKNNTSSSTPKGQLLGKIEYVDYFDLMIEAEDLSRPMLNYFSRVPFAEDDQAIRDLSQQLVREADQFGFETSEYSEGGLYLTPEDILFPINEGEDRAPQGRPNKSRRISDKEVAYEINSDQESGYGESEEREVDLLIAYTGASKDTPSGEKRRRVQDPSPLTPVQSPRSSNSRGSEMQEPSYQGGIQSFANDMQSIVENFGILMTLDPSISDSSLSMLRNRPSNAISSFLPLSNQEKYQILKKLTQNHIDQLKSQKRYSKKRQKAIDQGEDQTLSSFMQGQTTNDFLSMIRSLSSLDNNMRSMNVTEISTNLANNSSFNVPPHFNTTLLTTTTTPGVMRDGTLSDYVYGSMVEVKEMGSTSKGKKSAASQTAINTDLGQRSETTEGQFNRMSISRLSTSSPAARAVLSTRKRYKICKLIPYERSDLGIFKNEGFLNMIIANQYFLVEV